MDAGRDPLFAGRFFAFLPAPGGTPVSQFRECLSLLRSRLRASGLTDRDILRLTFFLDATDARTYARYKKRFVAGLVDSFGPLHPPASFVAQPPEKGRRVALEAAVLPSRAAGVRVQRKRLDGLIYTVVTGADFREVHGAGIAADKLTGSTSTQAKEAFERMKAVLRRERLTFGNVVRQWNYVGGIVDVRTGRGRTCQNYQAFNDVRTLFYGSSEFASGYPAATGIGQAAGGVILEFTALDAATDVRIVPLSNPRQVDAHRYSGGVLVGEPIEEISEKTSPKFERAKVVARGTAGIVFVSGTAAVLGQKSAGRRDVEAQTRIAAENISTLAGRKNLRRAGLTLPPDTGVLSYLRAYVKRTADIPKVRRICERTLGPIPALYVRADICRPELLVELEGIRLTETR
jgi:enamine deaminase RidA (YjgF/YER057c/UK114 family)